MSSKRAQKLRRLIKATRILYLQQTADLARFNSEASAIAESAALAEEYLGAATTELSFLTELGIARASKLRGELADAQSRLGAQLEKATDAMTKAKVAENLFDEERDSLERARTVRALEEVIDTAVGRRSSLG